MKWFREIELRIYYEDNRNGINHIKNQDKVYYDNDLYKDWSRNADLCRDGFDSDIVNIIPLERSNGLLIRFKIESVLDPETMVYINNFSNKKSLSECIRKYINNCNINIGYVLDCANNRYPIKFQKLTTYIYAFNYWEKEE